MKYYKQFGALGAIAVAAATTLVVSCGGGNNDNNDNNDAPVAIATTIDTASVAKGIAAVSDLIPVCNRAAPAAAARSLGLVKKFALGQIPARSIMALGSTPPADTLGSCGGRITFPAGSYSHLNGVTTATLEFVNYCAVSPGTSNRAVLNGSIAFVNTGTPSANGPITNKIEASSPVGVTLAVQDPAGQPIDSEVIAFTDFLYTVGVPGSSPTASNPDQFHLGGLTMTNPTTGRVYRETGYNGTMFATASGGSQFSVSGRGYRANGEYFDVATSTPIVLDSARKPVSGALTFTGANNSNAVVTLLPGTSLQATITVNGAAMTGLPTCQ